ncbi:MAG: hypothetical protein ABH896_01870 [Candidatus Jacksonbacteria bacterium]
MIASKQRDNKIISNYQGSVYTYKMVKAQIKDRWGEQAAQEYNPLKNCLTLPVWNSLGYRIRKGEKSIRSITFIKELDDAGNVINTFPRSVFLFFKTQVEKTSQNS